MDWNSPGASTPGFGFGTWNGNYASPNPGNPYTAMAAPVVPPPPAPTLAVPAGTISSPTTSPTTGGGLISTAPPVSSPITLDPIEGPNYWAPPNAQTLSGAPTPQVKQDLGVDQATTMTPANVASTPTPTPNTARQITAPETVSGQMNALLAEDSPYMQSAKATALAQANSRGLINSSLAVGAGQKAAIDSAMPIATQDATVNANAGQSAQQANQDVNLAGYNANLTAAQQAQNFGYSTAQNAQNIQGNLDISKQAQDAALVIQNLNISQQERASITSATAPIIQQVQLEISNIQRTPDQVLDANGKIRAINFQNQLLQANLKTLSSLYGFNISWA